MSKEFAPMKAILFFTVLKTVLSGKYCPSSLFFIDLFHMDELIKVLFILWVDSCFESGLSLMSLLQLLKHIIQRLCSHVLSL